MIPAETLRRRLVVASVVLVFVLAVTLDVGLYVVVRTVLLDHLKQVDFDGGDGGAQRATVEAALRRLVAFEAVATVLAVALAAGLFRRVASAMLLPLERMLEVVRRRTAGHQEVRIRPQSHALFGVLGEAYDEMLDAQDAAIAETRGARDRSHRFLADAAHQIRMPVADIQGRAETLLRRSSNAGGRDQESLKEMVAETSRVGRLVNDLVQAARLDQGVQLQRAPCDLVAVCREEVERLQRLEPNLELIAQAPGWDGRHPVLDAEAVQDIVANLLDNARRHARSRVEVTVASGSDTVEVRVSDDGPGLAAEAAGRVFERFVSLDGKGGSGLGLPIAQELARAHGGDVRYQDGQFVVSLPWGQPALLQPAFSKGAPD